MDEERMSLPSFDSLPAWAMPLCLAAHLAVGIVLGVPYFRGLWWNVCHFTRGGRATTALALMVGRFVLMGALALFASLEGALPMLALALGVLIARSAVMRRIRETAR
jgi:F1F0 ATPase subunit 2